MEQDTKERANISIDREVWKLIKVQAAIEDRRLDEVVEEAIQAYLAKKNGKSRATL